ncbi:110_t:CDS:10 [Diversispora eburnea]|uniref:enoyl-[acyl-carrier-protein] reductase n=1 Tax=Diversispora eburnea TaxID=1213867 RepID=A0A9N8VXM4_9GLOM|nr:110_t:CDS:10 [Diversispora eburnea]
MIKITGTPGFKFLSLKPKSSLLFNIMKSKRWLSSYIEPIAKAAVFNKHGIPQEVLRVMTYKLSSLTPSTLHLKFLAAPINPSDINQIEGIYPIKPLFRSSLGDKTFEDDQKVAVGGNEGVAEVIAVGENIKDIKVGDWVIMNKNAFGTWRTYAEAKPDEVLRIPHEGINLIQAATLSVNPCTAYRDFVIQNGANSGVGQFVIQMAKAWNINTINIIRERPNLQELTNHLKSLGATYVVSDKDIQKKKKDEFEWYKAIEDKGIVLGLNCVGGKNATYMTKLLRDSSLIVTYGGMSRQPLTIPASQLIFKDLKYVGFWISKWNKINSKEKRLEMLNEIINLIKQGKLETAVYEENSWGKDDIDKDQHRILEILKKATEEFNKIINNYDKNQEHDNKRKPSSFITQSNVKTFGNLFNNYDGNQKNNKSSPLITPKNIKIASKFVNNYDDNQNGNKSSSLITQKNVKNFQEVVCYSNIRKNQNQDDDNRSQASQIDSVINKNNLNKFKKFASKNEDELNKSFQKLQNIAAASIENRGNHKTNEKRKPPPLPPRQNSIVAEEPLDYNEENYAKDDNFTPPPLPPRRGTMTGVDDEPRQSSPRSARQNSQSVGSPQKRTSSNSVKSNESINSSAKSLSATLDSETFYENIDDYPDPVSRCLPIVGEGFQQHFDCSEYDFTSIDEYAWETPASETSSIEKLSYYLTSVWDYDLYKLRAIFAWIAHNISYDCSGASKFSTGKDVLRTRKAVCSGYSELFNDLSCEAGLNVWKITGNAKGAGYRVGDAGINDYSHAWNGTIYEGEYLLFDCTWGAGVVNNNQFKRVFRPFYFMCSPLKLIYTHYPEKTKYQYLQPPITRPEFINQPRYRPEFFEAGLSFILYFGCEIVAVDDNIILDIEQVNINMGDKITAHLDWNGQKIDTITQRLSKPGPKGGLINRIRIGCPTRGTGELIKNPGTGAKYKKFMQTFSTPFSCSIIKPIVASLAYTKKVRFEIIVFGQEDNLPDISIVSPGFEKKEPLRQIYEKRNEFGAFTMACDVLLNYKGVWNLVYQNKENSFSFIASYDVK